MALIQSKQLEYPLTGSFIDDGSGLTAISASSIIGLQDAILNANSITTGSVSARVNHGSNIFLIQSGSNKYFEIDNSSETVFHSDLFIIKNFTTGTNIFTVSQSIVQIATHSINPTGNTQAGSIYFTSSSFYVGLE